MSIDNLIHGTTNPILAVMAISDHMARSGAVQATIMSLRKDGLLMPVDHPVPCLQLVAPNVAKAIQKFNEMGLCVGDDEPIQLEDEGQVEITIFIIGLGQIMITRAK